MQLELLAFDLLILGPPVVASTGLWGRSAFFLDRWRRAWPSALAVSVPGVAVLASLVSGGALDFSPAHSFGPVLGPLPVGALILVLAVAFAAVFGWWVAFVRPGRGHPLVRFAAFLASVAIVSVVFGSALIERGILVTPPSAQAGGLALLGVPVESLGYVLALAGVAVLVFEGLELWAAAHPRKSLIARWIERRFGGYRHLRSPIDEGLPRELSGDARPRVAVVGAGLAGMGAAIKLAERGFAVSLIERNDYLGGKVGAWKTTLPDGQELGMEHGFHAFFHHYYNLNALFAELGVDRHYRNIGDYLILTADGRSYSFKDIETTPILNLLSLARHGIYNLREVAGRHTGPKMEALLRYDPAETFAAYDGVSYAQFADDARLPDSLKLVFNTFARAFFSDAEKMSMAELIKSFHFYYLSNDGGLIYDYLDDDYGAALLDPLREHMQRHGVEIHTGCSVTEITRGHDQRFSLRCSADGPGDEPFDYLVIAADVVGTRAMFEASPGLAAAAPETAAKVETLAPGQRYAVLRLWLDRDVERQFPGFVITERVQMLDAVTFVHRVERESRQWVAAREAAGLRGGVIELHCYAVPEELPDDEARLRELFITELHQFFPELAEAETLHACFYVRRDFPAFHVGKHATRPTWDTELENLFLAGDWVVLPFPAMLMEAAYSSGLLAANAICRAESLREEPVWTVPPRGFMAGWPKRPF